MQISKKKFWKVFAIKTIRIYPHVSPDTMTPVKKTLTNNLTSDPLLGRTKNWGYRDLPPPSWTRCRCLLLRPLMTKTTVFAIVPFKRIIKFSFNFTIVCKNLQFYYRINGTIASQTSKCEFVIRLYLAN